MLKYRFQDEPIDVGLAFSGTMSMVGPLTFAAVFLPASRHQDILLRYDLFHRNMSNWAASQLADIDRFNRLQTHNTAEIGYLVKSVLP